jgi:hypothetical protein
VTERNKNSIVGVAVVYSLGKNLHCPRPDCSQAVPVFCFTAAKFTPFKLPNSEGKRMSKLHACTQPIYKREKWGWEANEEAWRFVEFKQLLSGNVKL